MPRGDKGYGFDVRGHNPVHVSSVEHGQHTNTHVMTSSLHNNNYVITVGEAAQQADVRVGDAVVRVDDTDVRRANAELVQNLIA